MSTFKLDNSNFVEYRLSSVSFGEKVIQEPINFDEGNQNIYQRDGESKGFLTKKSNTLEFHNDGYEFLLKQVGSRGIAEDVVMTKWIKDETRLDQRWRIATVNYLDLTTLEFDQSKTGKGIAKCNADVGGLKKIIDSKLNDKIDLTLTTGSDLITLPPLETKQCDLPGRRIFLRSRIEASEGQQFVVPPSPGATARAIPLDVPVSSDENVSPVFVYSVLSTSNNNWTSLAQGNEASLFYLLADRERFLTFNGRVELVVSPDNNNILIGSNKNELALVKYFNEEGGNEFTYKTHYPLANGTIATGSGDIGKSFSFEFNDYPVEVLPGESLALGILCTNGYPILFDVVDTYIEITEDSSFPASVTRALTYKQIINRLLYHITGSDNLLVSELLTEGETGGLHEDLVASGFWIRQFPDIVKEGTDEERRIQYQTSLEEVFKHINVKEPMAWWVEEIGNQEYLRVESLKYTQQNFLGVQFANTGRDLATGTETLIYTEASDVIRTVLKDNFYSTIEIGSNKGGDGYEEVAGLLSIGGKSTFSTINKNSSSQYKALSPYRLSDIDVELPRRKPYQLYEDTDTRYDSDLIVLDCKINAAGNYELKKWQDVYESAPTGIYDPDSAYNLEHTPARFILKHGFIINSGLYQYPAKSLIFESGNGNSRFASKKVGEQILREDGSIPHSMLEPPRIKPFLVKCTVQVTQEIEDSILGKQNGIDNWFGLTAVKIRDQIVYFRLIKTDANKEGKHELVEANIV